MDRMVGKARCSNVCKFGCCSHWRSHRFWNKNTRKGQARSTKRKDNIAWRKAAAA